MLQEALSSQDGTGCVSRSHNLRGMRFKSFSCSTEACYKIEAILSFFVATS